MIYVYAIMAEAGKLIGDLFRAFIAAGIFYIVKKGIRSKGKLPSQLICFGLSLFVATTCYFEIGKPTCSYQPDPYSTCDDYNNDGFNPSNQERRALFIYVLLFTFIPASLGAMEATYYNPIWKSLPSDKIV